MAPVLGDECFVWCFSAFSTLNDQNAMNHNVTISSWNTNESVNTNGTLSVIANDSIDCNRTGTHCASAIESGIDSHCDKHCDVDLETAIEIGFQSATETVFESAFALWFVIDVKVHEEPTESVNGHIWCDSICTTIDDQSDSSSSWPLVSNDGDVVAA